MHPLPHIIALHRELNILTRIYGERRKMKEDVEMLISISCCGYIVPIYEF